MQTAIIGLAGSGKTTVFNTLTRGHAETGGYGGVTLNVGVVKVPDDRLERLAEIFKPKKIPIRTAASTRRATSSASTSSSSWPTCR
jgi:ribosome-binding ATPase YchF (GTP1/OBG family)